VHTRHHPAAIALAALLALATPAGADELPRTITVGGTGQVDGEPDRARVSFAIERRNQSMGVARDGVARVVRDFLALCRRLGIPEQKVRTAGLRIQPEYRYQNDGSPPVLVGYIVERQLDVDLGNLDRLGELIEGAIDAGVSQASPPEFDSSRRADRERDALAAAGEDARRNAERLAAALGARVGAVRQVSVGGALPPPPMPMARVAMAEGMAADAASYTPGELRFDARVTVTFDLLAP
jgi:uncharacterized protein YggE